MLIRRIANYIILIPILVIILLINSTFLFDYINGYFNRQGTSQVSKSRGSIKKPVTPAFSNKDILPLLFFSAVEILCVLGLGAVLIKIIQEIRPKPDGNDTENLASDNQESHPQQSSEMSTKLIDIVGEHISQLSTYPWISEEDRWKELVFCFLYQFKDKDSAALRKVVNTLGTKDLLQIRKLADSGQMSDGQLEEIFTILTKAGFKPKEAEEALYQVSMAAKTIEDKFNGKLQSYTRQKGEQLRDEISQILQDGGVSLPKDQIENALTLWLQNAFNFPIGLKDERLRKFCEKNNISFEDLYKSADQINFNVAYLDELAELDSRK